MDTNTLRTFILAAEYENFRVAAEKMYITQPGVTFQIRHLEKELGDKLFMKNGRNIALTEFGRLFYLEAKELVQQYEQSLEKLNRFKQGYHKIIRIAISPLLADTLFPSILREYTKKFPNVEMVIEVLESDQISSRIENGDVDIGISCLPGSRMIHSTKLHEEPVSLICSHDGYDAESGPIIDARELLENNIIITDNHPVYWYELKEQLSNNLQSYKFMRVNQTHITKRFVLESIGVSFLPKSIINRDLLEGRLLEVDVPFIKMPTASMYVLYKYDHQIESDFLKFVSNFHIS
ncbi:LysR family transcriptional regulator [Virgibacillus flavescens]|uniref:LysR family transcriptional regulator n=1 Tax=Virgibacillus flavescens TaxID=1611422 RepID=UPI003D334473